MTTAPHDSSPLPRQSSEFEPNAPYPPETRVRQAYAASGIRELLGKFVRREPYSADDPAVVNETDLDQAFGAYAIEVAEAALASGDIDVPLLKQAFDTVVAGMRDAAAESLPEPEPRSLVWKLLERAGVSSPAPEPTDYAPGLDDRYWTEQFPQAYAAGRSAPQFADEPEAYYLASVFQRSLHGYALAPFTQLPISDRPARSS